MYIGSSFTIFSCAWNRLPNGDWHWHCVTVHEANEWTWFQAAKYETWSSHGNIFAQWRLSRWCLAAVISRVPRGFDSEGNCVCLCDSRWRWKVSMVCPPFRGSFLRFWHFSIPLQITPETLGTLFVGSIWWGSRFWYKKVSPLKITSATNWSSQPWLAVKQRFLQKEKLKVQGPKPCLT